MTKTNAVYSLERGVRSPRDGSVSWQLYDLFDTLPAAKKEALRGLSKESHLRITRTETVWLKEPEET